MKVKKEYYIYPLLSLVSDFGHFPLFLLVLTFLRTRPCTTLRAAGLDGIVGPSYSLGLQNWDNITHGPLFRLWWKLKVGQLKAHTPFFVRIVTLLGAWKSDFCNRMEMAVSPSMNLSGLWPGIKYSQNVMVIYVIDAIVKFTAILVRFILNCHDQCLLSNHNLAEKNVLRQQDGGRNDYVSS